MTIHEFIKSNNNAFDHYRTFGEWNGYNVYYVYEKRNEGCCVGLPQFALEKDGTFRMADVDEIHTIMRR